MAAIIRPVPAATARPPPIPRARDRAEGRLPVGSELLEARGLHGVEGPAGRVLDRGELADLAGDRSVARREGDHHAEGDETER
ncbi:MAG: hypothetical protein H6710_00130 [Myxococcales bacterium]|nr:hypothetical protein [Myxococcales bacterium]